MSKEYKSGTGYSAIVTQNKQGKHVAKFFKDGEYMTDADYEGKDSADAHEFAQDEMKHRSYEHATSKGMDKYIKESSESMRAFVLERINMPQGHEHQPDPISNDSVEDAGRKKKMMGNRTPLEVIAKILARN